MSDEKTNNKLTEDAINSIQSGNGRFFTNKSITSSDILARQREKTKDSQSPVAVIVTCADSRVAPEYIFDQGIGDIFVVRSAGNIISSSEIASVEYAVSQLNVPFIVILGHTRCGAVHATLNALQTDTKLNSPYLEYLKEKIAPALRSASKSPDSQGESLINEMTLDTAISINIQNSVDQLITRSLIVKNAINKNELFITGALYELESGLVSFL